MDEQVFNDLCKIVICAFADCRYEQQAKEAAQRLAEQEVLESPHENAYEKLEELAYEKYEEMVKEYALEHLPDGYDMRYDYYGAKVITDNQGWNAPKTGLYSGDSSGRIMFFQDFAALKEYTQEKVNEIDAAIADDDEDE